MDRINWTFDNCYREAKQFKTKIEFRNNNRRAYDAACRHKWIDKFNCFISGVTPANYWTYEKCYEEAKKYTCRSEFQRKKRGAYKAALRNKWLDNYTWFEKPEAHNKKWNYETCYEEAKKYKSFKEFRENATKALELAKKSGWISEYTWLKRFKIEWTYEKCYEEAKKYTCRSEFRKNAGGCFAAAERNGWVEDYTWIPKRKKVESKWTKELCFEIGKRFKTKSEFEKNEKGCYIACVRAGWLKEMDWFVPSAISLLNLERRDYVVYLYKSEVYNVAYVGLTYDIKMRHNRHKLSGSVCNFFKNKESVEFPQPIILKENLNCYEAQYYEDFYKKEYENRGYSMLNKGATGLKTGSIGGGQEIYNKEKVFESAKKYATIKDFALNDKSCYLKAQHCNWLKEMPWLQKAHHDWTYKECYEIAKKYEYKKDFHKNDRKAHDASKRRGWFKDYTWLKNTKYKIWTYDNCVEESKKYKTIKEFRKKNSSCYSTCCKNKWIDDFIWLERKQMKSNYWNNKDRATEVARECKTLHEFEKRYYSAYSFSLENGWLNEFTWLERKRFGNNYWTFERVKELADNVENMTEMRKVSYSAYGAAKKNGWIDKLFPK